MKSNANTMMLMALLFLAILAMPSALAPKPIITSPNDVGLSVKIPLIDFIKPNSTVEFEFHVFNATDGQAIRNFTSCNLHIYNASGYHIFEAVDGYVGHDYDYSFKFGENNFTNLGTYSYIVYCNTSGFGGFAETSFEVDTTSWELTTAKAVLYVGFFTITFFVFIMLFIGAIKIPYSNLKNGAGEVISISLQKYFKIACIIGAYVTLIFVSGLARGITYNYLYTIGVHQFFNLIYWILMSLFYPMLIITFVLVVATVLSDKRFSKALEDGIPIE